MPSVLVGKKKTKNVCKWEAVGTCSMDPRMCVLSADGASASVNFADESCKVDDDDGAGAGEKTIVASSSIASG